MRKLICTMMVAGLYAGATPVLAGDEPLCLECHEPAEDWKDLTTAQIIADAKAPITSGTRTSGRSAMSNFRPWSLPLPSPVVLPPIPGVEKKKPPQGGVLRHRVLLDGLGVHVVFHCYIGVRPVA